MSRFEPRLRERAVTYDIDISDAHIARLTVYAELLERWNRRINLTALPLDGWPDQTLDRLILEPVAAAPLAAGFSGTWVDLGTGGGSPALPLAVCLGDLPLTMTESRGKKAAFLREAARALELKQASVIGRFEELLAWRAGSVAFISCRAVSPEDTASVSNHLLAPSGCMLYFGSSALPDLGGLSLEAQQLLPGVDAVASVLRRKSRDS